MTLASIAKFLTKPFSDNGKPSINHFTSLKSAKTETQLQKGLDDKAHATERTSSCKNKGQEGE